MSATSVWEAMLSLISLPQALMGAAAASCARCSRFGWLMDLSSPSMDDLRQQRLGH